jgi:hypothetical protein
MTFNSRTWCRKRAPKLNGYCYLKLFKSKYRYQAVNALQLEPDAAKVWKYRSWFHNHLDKFEFVQTARKLYHIVQHAGYNVGYFDKTFSLKMGRIAGEPRVSWGHLYEPPARWTRNHVLLLQPSTPEPTQDELELCLQSLTTGQPNNIPNHQGFNEETFNKYMLDFFKSSFFTSVTRASFNLPQIVENLHQLNDWYVPVDATLTQQQRQGAARRLALSLHMLFETQKTFINQYKLTQSVKQDLEGALEARDNAENERKRIKRESDQTLATLAEEKARAETQRDDALASDRATTQRLESAQRELQNSALRAAEDLREQIKRTNTLRAEDLKNLLRVQMIPDEDYATILSKWGTGLLAGLIDIEKDILTINEFETIIRDSKEQLNDLQTEQSIWEDIISRNFPELTSIDMIEIEVLIQRLKRRSDQNPFWELLRVPPSRRRPMDTSQLMANEINTRFMEILGEIWAAVPPDFQEPRTGSPATHIKEGIARLQNKINLLTSSYNRLTTSCNDPTHQNSNMATQEHTLQTLWNRIPAIWRTNDAGEEIPFSQENLETALDGLPTAAPGAAPCNHVQEMDGAIRDHAGPENRMNWLVMLNHVNRHCNPQDFERPNPNGEPPSRAASPALSHMSIATSQQQDPVPQQRAWKKFEGTLPEFDGNSEEWPMWKARLRNFWVLNKGCPGDEFAAYVFTKLSGSAAVWATQTDPVRFSMVGNAPLTAHVTMERIIDDMEREFADATLEKRARARLHTIQQKAETPMTQHVATFRDLVVKAGRSTNSDYIIERFIGSCYWDVRNDLEDLTITKKRLGEPFPFAEVVEWAQVKDSQYSRHRAKKNDNERPRKDAPAESNYGTSWAPPAECANHTDRNGCPQHLKGSLGDRESTGGAYKRAAILELGRCLTCRGVKQPGEQGYVANPPTPAAAWPENTPMPEPRTRSQTAGRGRGYRGRGQ